jgi:hypothetical protein
MSIINDLGTPIGRFSVRRVVFHDAPRDFGFKSPVDPFYFSFTTMSSVGYGDFSPKTNRAKMIVMSQQVIVAIGIFTLIENYVRVK